MATSPPSIPPQADYSDDNVRPSIPPSPDPYPNQIELAVARGIKHPPTVHADFVVKGGKPLVHPNRDPRHPQLYLVSNHHHVDPEHPFLRYILVFIQDTRKKARTAQFKFEESLQVPLGPLKVQYKSGLYILPHGTIIFVRKMGEVDPSKDRAVCWSFTGDKVYGKNLKQGLAQCHEDLIGDASECTLDPPERKNGVYTGGTRFERFGQEGVDKPRVYKFSISNQRQRKMVGPTAGGKVINLDGGAWTPNVEARSRTLKTGTGIAMFSHDQCAPDYLKDTLKKNAELNNVPSIGVADNHCFPGMQVNFAPAIPFEDCKTQGLQGMGDFGSVDGHRDRGDSPAGMTTMVSCSRLPEDYEPGTFFLLYLGVGFVLITSLVCTFLGLYKHGGGPVIAPEGAVKVEPSAYRVILVLYPPASAISAAGVNHIPLSSLPNGDLFKLGAEMTSPFYLDKLKEIVVSNEANYGSDGAPLMTPESHMKFMIGSYLQTCQALSLPLPPAYNVKIDPEIFYSAFKFTNEAGDECQGAAPPQHDPQQQRDEMDAMMESVAEFVPYMRNRDVRQWNRDIADEIDKAPVLRKSKSSAHKGNKAAAVKRKNDLEAGAPNVVKKSGTKRKPITDDSDCGTAHKRSKVGAIESETSSDESEDDWPSTRVQPHRRVFVEVPSLSPSIAAKHKALSNPSKLGYASFPLVTQDFFRMDMSEASNMDVDSGNSSTPLDNPDVIGDPGSSDDDGTRRSSRLQDSDMSVAEDVSLAGHENHGMKEPSHSQPCKDDFIPTEEINMVTDNMCSKVLDNSATSLSDHSNADTVIRTTQSSKLRINSLLLSDSFESDTCVQGNCSSAMYSNPPSSPGSDTMKLSPRPLSPRLVPDDISMTCHSLADICLAQESVDTQRNSLPLENCVFEDVSRSYRGVPIASLLNYETVPEKWDSNRLSDVETLLDPTASRRQSTRERDVCKFLDQLNVDNIQKEINVFRNALQACENTPSLWGDMYEISIADMPNITPMLDLLNRDPLSLDTAYKIPIFWKDVRRTTDVADVTSACLRLLRLRALQATVKIYQWLVTLIQAAVRWDAPSSGSPWLHKLVHDVQNVFYSPHYSFGTVVEFDSWDYLPALTYPRTYSLVLPRFSSTPMDDIKAYSAIIARFWLGFPPDLPSLSVAGVLTELLDAHSIIILLLDPVWELFSSQGCNLMSSLKQDQRARPRYHIELLETVSSRLKVHPIRDPASPECLKLQELSTSMSLWIGPQNNKLVEDLKPMLLESPHTGPIHKDVPDILSHLPPADLQGVAALLSFIRRLLPLLNSIHLPPDDLAKFVAKNLDFRSPFRQRAPTLQRAFATIYSDLDRLQTTAGLFNVVLFRGFTYGSSWARTSLNWFNDYSTWKSVYDNSTVPADAKSRSSYFINPCAYGTCASARDLAHSKKIEKALTKSGWCAFIEAQRRVKDSCLSEQFFFFKQFPAVGSLTSLLIVGDLIKAGLLPIPVAYDFGILVAHVKRGALNGLVRLGLVSHESSSEEIAEAFENLHLQLLEDLTLDEIRMMDYDIVTLEHILCKFSRLHNEI